MKQLISHGYDAIFISELGKKLVQKIDPFQWDSPHSARNCTYFYKLPL